MVSNKTFIYGLILFSILINIAFCISDGTNNNATEDDNTYQPQWEEFKQKFKKGFDQDSVEKQKKTNFIKNLKNIKKHNADKNNTFELDINQFGDMSFEEFQSMYLTSLIPPKNRFLEAQEEQHEISDEHHRLLQTSTSIDWRALGKVTAVKNQGQCGSCWAFSAVGAIESLAMIKNNTSFDLSEQELVDCSSSYGNQACNGGWMTYAYNYVQNKKVSSEASYPYKAIKGTCLSSSTPRVYQTSSYKAVSGVTGLKSALLQQPVAVAVCVDYNFQMYKTGIFTGTCTTLNHGVLAVGFTNDYWIVKNSWGTSWGENGYIRIKMGSTIGITSSCSYPTKTN